MVVIETGEVTVLVNPVIVRRSRKKMTLWDDCFSFPDLAVKVKRNVSVEVRYQDIGGHQHRIHAEGALSELLQHEIDHLDGILAIDRAIDSNHIVYKKELERKDHEREPVML
jgi:peptide deformylase